ncbi:MAG TPA: D-2-hydroxyacid dehydrogenase family protein [Polyangiaceae bacterium]|nr:D-2-hydroxyacid dehydrogenase family protein [Polyangiaceae bacterium]
MSTTIGAGETAKAPANGSGARPIRVAILDDYQRVARRFADWGSLPEGSEVSVFHDHVSDETALERRLGRFEAIVAMRERTPFPASLLSKLPELKLLVTTGMRNAAIDLEAAARAGITVSGTHGLSQPTAELTWGLILALARRIPIEDHALRSGSWQTSLGVGLHGKTLGVLGLGRLGTQVARIGVAFGMEVLAWSPHLTLARAIAADASLVDRDELFRRADVLTVHLVLSDRTRGIVGPRELGLMKKSALFINTSRGPLVDENALLHALRARAIAGAGLDVFDHEPLPSDHPLLELPNTVLTPHLGYVTEDTYRVFYSHALSDVQAYLAGQPLRVLTA